MESAGFKGPSTSQKHRITSVDSSLQWWCMRQPAKSTRNKYRPEQINLKLHGWLDIPPRTHYIWVQTHKVQRLHKARNCFGSWLETTEVKWGYIDQKKHIYSELTQNDGELLVKPPKTIHKIVSCFTVGLILTVTRILHDKCSVSKTGCVSQNPVVYQHVGHSIAIFMVWFIAPPK